MPNNYYDKNYVYSEESRKIVQEQNEKEMEERRKENKRYWERYEYITKIVSKPNG
jgi:hypothetical protein